MRPDAHAMTRIHIQRLSAHFNHRDYGAIQTYIRMVDANVFLSHLDRLRIFDDWRWALLLYRFVARCVASRVQRRVVLVNEHTLNYSPVCVGECILLRAINNRYYAFTTHEMVQVQLHSIYHQEFGISKPIVPKHPYTNDALTPVELRHICNELRRRLAYVPDAICTFQKARFRVDVLASLMRPVLQKRAMLSYCRTIPTLEVEMYVHAFAAFQQMSVCRRCIIDAKGALLDWTADYLLFCNHLLHVTHETLHARLCEICVENRISMQHGKVPLCRLHYRRYRPKSVAPLSSSSATRASSGPFETTLKFDACTAPPARASMPFRFTSPSTETRDALRTRVRGKRPRERRATSVRSMSQPQRPPPPPPPPPPPRPTSTTTVPNLNLMSVLQLLRTSIATSSPTRARTNPPPVTLLLQIDHPSGRSSTRTTADMPDIPFMSDASEDDDEEDEAIFNILSSLFTE
jgi:hypothetical protein